MMLGAKISSAVFMKIGDFSTFSTFWVKPAVVDRDSSSVIAVEGAA